MRKALFLDRDGVVNIDHGYLYKQEDFEFQSGIFELCRRALAENYIIIIVTNQSGIARGLYSEEDFDILTQWMKLQFLEQQVTITDVYYCPHHSEKGLGQYKVECNCRKPEPGMLLQAAQVHNIDLSASIMVGDKESDINAAIAAGISKRFLLSSQYHKNSTILADHVIKIDDILSEN